MGNELDSGSERGPGLSDEAVALTGEWRRLRRAATAVALLTSPAFFLVLYRANGWSLVGALLGTAFGVVVFAGWWT